MKDKFTFPARIVEEEPGEWLVSFPDLPEALTSGDDFDDALAMAEDCLAEAIAGRIDDNEEIPLPSELTEGLYSVTCPAQVALKAIIYQVMQSQEITKVKLAEMLEVNEKEARRITDPHHGTKLQTLTRTLRALGKQVITQVVDLPKHA
jgi:antitoxin HicB